MQSTRRQDMPCSRNTKSLASHHGDAMYIQQRICKLYTAETGRMHIQHQVHRTLREHQTDRGLRA